MRKIKIFQVSVYEYERGMGCRLDGLMLCSSYEQATDFVEEYNKRNVETHDVPDIYTVAEEIEEIEITKKQKEIMGNGCMRSEDLEDL